MLGQETTEKDLSMQLRMELKPEGGTWGKSTEKRVLERGNEQNSQNQVRKTEKMYLKNWKTNVRLGKANRFNWIMKGKGPPLLRAGKIDGRPQWAKKGVGACNV